MLSNGAMGTDRITEIPFGNGEPVPEIELVLSTGYRVLIDPREPVESFEHLVRAFLGEVFLKVSGEEGDVRKNNSARSWFCKDFCVSGFFVLVFVVLISRALGTR